MATACRNVQHRSGQGLESQSIEESLVLYAEIVPTIAQNTMLHGNLTVFVVETMAVYNFIRRSGQVDEAFQAVDEVVDAAEIDLPDQLEETAADTFAPGNPNREWDQLRDHIAQMLR
ncbi:Uncharacterized protein Adt_14134 [Abeliophyllum distichum]|uniref:Uncharacterized protein n=1 Tax=Abeliophyllum distichum TaxID=126358 RepID=A0ABD1TYS4_9LAMI